MAKREFVQLAHVFDPKKHGVAGWFMSEKLDGQRCWWDGGITTGLPVAEVPWANREKDARFINQRIIATGLWSRNGKVIHAPGWWVDRLPKISIDGELYAGRGNYQLTASVVRNITNPSEEWSKIRLVAIDSPDYSQILNDGEINTSFYKKTLVGCYKWAQHRSGTTGNVLPFESNYANLCKHQDNDSLIILKQERLPYSTKDAIMVIDAKLEEVTKRKGEGVILRHPTALWTPSRTWNMLKYKPEHDSEAKVVGYVWGKKTDKGSKLLGKMGALVVDWNGMIFELSGFTEAERQMVWKDSGISASQIGEIYPGKMVDDRIHNANFPLGSIVTFKYRELTDRGCPKEGRYYRKL